MLFGRGDGTLASPFFYRPDWEPGPFTVADVTGDGIADVSVLTTIDGLSVLVGSCGPQRIFSDGFESGHLGTWTRSAP